MLRVALADDAVLLREGLVAVLARFGHEVVAAAGDAAALTEAVAAARPDVVVTDVRMPPSFTDEGLRAALDLRRAQPGLPVLVLSQYVATGYAAKLLEPPDASGVGYRAVVADELPAGTARQRGGGEPGAPSART